jgi:hypothetical protein
MADNKIAAKTKEKIKSNTKRKKKKNRIAVSTKVLRRFLTDKICCVLSFDEGVLYEEGRSSYLPLCCPNHLFQAALQQGPWL